MSEIIRVQDQYYILATSPLADAQTRVLKQGETFAIFDVYGDMKGIAQGEQGLYHNGTRHLSRSRLYLGKDRPLVLGSTVTEDNATFAVDLTNPDMELGGTMTHRGALHILRSIFLWDGCCYERIRLFNYADDPLPVELSFEVSADFADIFEVRGFNRASRGVLHPPAEIDGALVMRYEGLDGVERRTLVLPSEDGRIDGDRVLFEVTVEPKEPLEVGVTVSCEAGGSRTSSQPLEHQTAAAHQQQAADRLRSQQVRISTSNEVFNQWLDRSLSDLRMMISPTEHGDFPYAGVPWFAAPFGRDSIITALQMMWVDPTLARGVLAYLAATQATTTDADRESQPGKIIHEQRTGELAALGEVPFGSYYGSIDATPLFVALAGEYLSHTADRDFLAGIWDNIDAALGWMDDSGDIDGDGFLEYQGSERALVQQGWKDSHDSVFHADGDAAEPPIALCEVQAYAYWAKVSAARIARVLGKLGRAAQLEEQASVLRRSFEERFWLPELGTYALALDGEKRPCAVRASNAGHCLIAGMIDPQRARSVADVLMADDCFTGWGIRTLATSETRYGPITYHNGSVWPHDNSLIALGLSTYGFKDEVHRILHGHLDASGAFEFHRLPELFCGFGRRPGQGPIDYPLACAPQAWAAGSVFLMLRACLGMSVDATRNMLLLHRPSLPDFLREVRVEGLRVGTATVDLELTYHHATDVGVNVLGRTGDVEVVTLK